MVRKIYVVAVCTVPNIKHARPLPKRPVLHPHGKRYRRAAAERQIRHVHVASCEIGTRASLPSNEKLHVTHQRRFGECAGGLGSDRAGFVVEFPVALDVLAHDH